MLHFEILRKNRFIQILTLFLLFHIFWLLYYYLSETGFLKSGLWLIYLKYSIINSLGFFVFCISAFLLFPKFISSKKYLVFFCLSFLLLIGFAFIQFKLQDWDPGGFSFLPKKATPSIVSKPGKKIIAAMPMKQPVGAYVRSTLTIFVYLLLGIGYAYMKDWFVKDRYTQVLEKEKLKAELTLLRYQLNPHFLFNTINDIYYLAIIKSDKTADAILKVSNLLRYVLNEKEENTHLEKEIEYLKEFIKLQQFRFPDQIINVDISYSDKINQFSIAPLLLLTFAENAFKHGEPGTINDPIKILLQINKNDLIYEVVNKISFNNNKDSTTGIGLNNLKRRLALLYPNKHNLVYKQENNYFFAQLKIKLI